MVQKIRIEEFLELAKTHPVFDVRSPGEYNHAHIPKAINLPLFTDEERKVVGTSYKQESRETAIKIGLDYFGVKMRGIVETVENIIKQQSTPDKTILVHCWRGGMRSGAIAWLLDLYGFKIFTLAGGYKSFRNWALTQFEKNYSIKIIGGYTGSGKTPVLNSLATSGQSTIDLEGIANHKGSAFGGINRIQPSQEMFENHLALQLYNATKNLKDSDCIWLEDESQRIGLVNIPHSFWIKMRNAPVKFLSIPFEERLKYIVEDYGKLPKEKLIDATNRIQKRLGGLDTKNAVQFLAEDNFTEGFRILLSYYDKHYEKGLNNRENKDQLISYIECDKVSQNNYLKLLN